MQNWLISITSCRQGICDCIENTHRLIHKANSLLGAFNQTRFYLPITPEAVPTARRETAQWVTSEAGPVPRTEKASLNVGWPRRWG